MSYKIHENNENNKKIKAAVFDLDGTLLNTLSDLTKCVGFALKKFGYEDVSQETVRKYAGNGAKNLIENLIELRARGQESLNERENLNGLRVNDSTINQITRAYLKQYETLVAGGIGEAAPYEGILPMLGRLREMGVKCGVVSNKPDYAAKKLCSDFFSDYIQIVFGETKGLRRKPHPDMVLRLLKEIDTPLENAILIGDSEVDIITAENVGLRFVCVSWGFRDLDYLINSGAKNIIHNPLELFELFESF